MKHLQFHCTVPLQFLPDVRADAPAMAAQNCCDSVFHVTQTEQVLGTILDGNAKLRKSRGDAVKWCWNCVVDNVTEPGEANRRTIEP